MTSDAKLTQSPDGMSDTPRTDAIEAGFAGWDKLRWIPHVVVQKSLAHARELERECKRREYGPIPQVENAVENPAVSPDAPVGTGSGPVSGVTGRRDGHIDDIDRLLCLFENSSALYWQNDQNERVSDRRLLEMFDAMNKRRHELVVGINALRAECQRDPRQSQPKCHSCGGWVKVEEGGICLPCHTEGRS
jgi:hypothetical protein